MIEKKSAVLAAVPAHRQTRSELTEAYNEAARTAEASGQKETSIVWYRKAIETLPSDRDTLSLAGCIDEWTRKPILKQEAVAETVRPVKIEPVGAYALQIAFNDGHSTGIYTFQMLRDMH